MKFQMKKINLLSFVLLTFLTVTITSCSEEVNGVIDSANFIEDIENRSVEAKGTCFRLLFPIGVSLGGEDTMVDSYKSLKEVIEAYKEAEGEDAERPTFVFPITLESVEGEQTVVSSQEEFEDVKSACDRRRL